MEKTTEKNCQYELTLHGFISWIQQRLQSSHFKYVQRIFFKWWQGINKQGISIEEDKLQKDPNKNFRFDFRIERHNNWKAFVFWGHSVSGLKSSFEMPGKKKSINIEKDSQKLSNSKNRQKKKVKEKMNSLTILWDIFKHTNMWIEDLDRRKRKE